jgi:hypothetical protein
VTRRRTDPQDDTACAHCGIGIDACDGIWLLAGRRCCDDCGHRPPRHGPDRRGGVSRSRRCSRPDTTPVMAHTPGRVSPSGSAEIRNASTIPPVVA